MSVNHAVLCYSSGRATSFEWMELQETVALLGTEGVKLYVLVNKHNRIA